MTTIIVMILLGATAGLVQGVTGFGVGIVIMSLLPYCIGIGPSVATQGVVTVGLSLMVAWQYRRDVNLPRVLPATFFYICASGTAIWITASTGIAATRGFNLVFGAILIGLSFYFLRFAGKLHLRASLGTALICGAGSGILDGFFGIGGPLMVLFLLAVSDSRGEYIANMQICFLLTDLFNCILRAGVGILTPSLFGLGLIGIVGVAAGVALARPVSRHVSDALFLKLVYSLIGLSGLLTFLRAL